MADPVIAPMGPSTLARDWYCDIQTNPNAATLSSALTTGSPITTIAVAALTAAIAPYSSIQITSGTNTQNFTVGPAGAAMSSTSIPVLSVTPNFAYPTTSSIVLWSRLRAVKNLVPTVTPTDQDDSDYDSGGYKSSSRTALAWSITATIARKQDLTTTPPSYDVAQEALRAVHDQMGVLNRVAVRWYRMDPNVRSEAYSGFASVGWVEVGGAEDANRDVNLTLSGQGKRSAITHPYALP